MITLVPHTIALSCGLVLACRQPPSTRADGTKQHGAGRADAVAAADAQRPLQTTFDDKQTAKTPTTALMSPLPTEPLPPPMPFASPSRVANAALLASLSRSLNPAAAARRAPRPSGALGRTPDSSLLASLSHRTGSSASVAALAGADNCVGSGADSDKDGGKGGCKGASATLAKAEPAAYSAVSGVDSAVAVTTPAAWPRRWPPMPRSLVELLDAALADSRLVVALLGLWRAIEVGTLHAYHTVRLGRRLGRRSLSEEHVVTIRSSQEPLVATRHPLSSL